jgi:hypothetical protein
MARGWRINAFGLAIIVLFLGWFLEKYGGRILDIIEGIFK